MYDTARRVALVKQRVRENTRRRQRRGIYGLSAACMLLCTALMQAALERFRSVRQVQLLTDDTEKTKGFYRSLGLLTLPELGCCGFMRP